MVHKNITTFFKEDLLFMDAMRIGLNKNECMYVDLAYTSAGEACVTFGH